MDTLLPLDPPRIAALCRSLGYEPLSKQFAVIIELDNCEIHIWLAQHFISILGIWDPVVVESEDTLDALLLILQELRQRDPIGRYLVRSEDTRASVDYTHFLSPAGLTDAQLRDFLTTELAAIERAMTALETAWEARDE